MLDPTRHLDSLVADLADGFAGLRGRGGLCGRAEGFDKGVRVARCFGTRQRRVHCV